MSRVEEKYIPTSTYTNAVLGQAQTYTTTTTNHLGYITTPSQNYVPGATYINAIGGSSNVAYYGGNTGVVSGGAHKVVAEDIPVESRI